MYAYLNGQQVGEFFNGTVYFISTDHLGSTRLLTGLDGSVQESDDYYPYGEPITTGTQSLLKFTGKERDTESGLDNFGARYYGSSMGRFMTPDWAARPTTVPYAVFGDPQSLNLYGYVRNDPISQADADGHISEEAACPDPHGCSPDHNNNPDPKPNSEPAKDANQDQPKSDQSEQKPPKSWDPTKPLPDKPSELGPEWRPNPKDKNPNGQEYINDKTGEKIEWNKGRPGPWGPKSDRGSDGWHYTPPGGTRGPQLEPGITIKTAVKVGFWGTLGAITIRVLQMAGESAGME
jgi:RHS repeat-associated protein